MDMAYEKKTDVARTIIELLVKNLQQNGEKLYSKWIVPADYEVWLHPADHARLESILDEIVADARLALEGALERLNRASKLDPIRGAIGQPRLPYRKVGAWNIRILADRLDDPALRVEPGQVLVLSKLAASESASLDGTETRCVATTGRIHALDVSRATAASSEPTAFATLAWSDEDGPRSYRMTKPEIVIGRESPAGPDVGLHTPVDVSRRHCSIVYDEASRQFWIRDLSKLGTTVNGAPIPPSREMAGSDERGEGARTPLPPQAEIGLAEKIQIRFTSEVHR